MDTNSTSRNVVSGSTTYEPLKAVNLPSWPVRTTRTATSARPMNVTASAGTLRPGAMKSTMMIEAATRIAAMNGASVTASEKFTGVLLPPQAERDGCGLLHGGERVAHGAGDQVQDEAREEAEDDDQGTQRNQREGLHRTHVGQVVAEALEEVGDLAEGHPLEHPEQVPGGQDHHEGRDRGRGGAGGERADQDQELAHEAGQARQADRREDEEAERGRVDGRLRAQASHLRDGPVVSALVDHAHEQEQGAGDEAV